METVVEHVSMSRFRYINPVQNVYYLGNTFGFIYTEILPIRDLTLNNQQISRKTVDLHTSSSQSQILGAFRQGSETSLERIYITGCVNF